MCLLILLSACAHFDTNYRKLISHLWHIGVRVSYTCVPAITKGFSDFKLSMLWNFVQGVVSVVREEHTAVYRGSLMLLTPSLSSVCKYVTWVCRSACWRNFDIGASTQPASPKCLMCCSGGTALSHLGVCVLRGDVSNTGKFRQLYSI
jgi:hypothetical protein